MALVSWRRFSLPCSRRVMLARWRRNTRAAARKQNSVSIRPEPAKGAGQDQVQRAHTTAAASEATET